MAAHTSHTAVAAGRYRIERLLGEGNTKRVYLAHDERLGREVALAVLKTEGLDGEQLLRFHAEARAMARLGDHPHVVTIHDLGIEDGAIYLVTEYLSGGDLRDRLAAAEGRRLPVALTLALGTQLASALAHAHARGVVHRDLNPGNVWFAADGRAKLGDFGLGVSLARARMVRDGLLATSVAYMAPEHALGHPADARGDLYSLGAMLYEMVTGRPPFLGDDAIAVLSQQIHAVPVAPSWLNPAVTPSLELVIMRLLAKAPAERPASAADTLAILAAAEAATTGRAAAARADASANPLDRLAAGAFVGREDVLRTLRDGVEGALSGHGSCVLLVGGAGIGKTRTAHEAATYARLRGARFLEGSSDEDEGAPAYWPLVQALRAWAGGRARAELRADLGDDAGVLATLLPELRRWYRDLPDPPTLDAASARFRLFEAVARVLTGASRREPLVLLCDDLHWADQATLRLLQFLAQHARDGRVLLIGTYRPHEVRTDDARAAVIGDLRRHARVVDLIGLGEADVGRFVETVAGMRVAPDIVAALHRRTEGNPLFVTEVVRLLAASGRLERVSAAEIASTELPEGVRHAIRRRLAALSRPSRRVLEIAAVGGAEIGVELLAQTLAGDAAAGAASEPDATAGSPEAAHPRSAGDTAVVAARARALGALSEAVGARIVAPREGHAGRYRFTHALVREALYESLSELDRIDLHRRLGEALERAASGGEAPVADLAHHFFKAAAGGTAGKAARYAIRAGDEALANWAHEEAVRHYERALAALDLAGGDDHARCDVLLALAGARSRVGESEAARDGVRQAAALARTIGPAAHLARAALGYPIGLTAADVSAGHFDPEAVALLEEALAALGPADGELRVRVLARLAGSRLERRPLTEEAVAMARRLGDPATLGCALAAHAWALWGPGVARERLALAAELVGIADRLGDKELALHGHNAFHASYLQLGDRAGADHHHDIKDQLTTELRQPLHRWNVLLGYPLRAFLDGDFAASERLAMEALVVGQQVDPMSAVQAFAGQQGVIRREQGRCAEVEPAIAGLVAAQPNVPVWRCNHAFVLAELGRLAEARGHLEHLAARDFADIPRDGFIEVALAHLAEVVLALEDGERAPRLYELLTPYAEHHLMVVGTLSLGPAARLLGGLAALLRRWEIAEEHFAAAHAQNESMRARPWKGHTHLDHARLLIRRDRPGDRARAGALLDTATAVGEAHGMTRLLALVEDARAQLAARPAAAAAAETAPHGEAEAVAPRAAPAGAAAAAAREVGIFRREGEYWTIVHGGRTVRVRNVKGLHYVAYLLAAPGREVHVLDLLALTEGTVAAAASAEAELQVTRSGAQGDDRPSDARARREYRERIRELEEDLAEAERLHDTGRAERVRAEIELLRDELRGAYGVGDAARSAASSPTERARKAVYNRIRSATMRLEADLPELARHLATTVRTGTVCVYYPDRPLRWRVTT